VRRKSVIAASLPIRRGLDENEAAVYLSLSPSFFRKLVAEKRMPRPRVAGGRRVWNVAELDVAFKLLPREGGDDEPIFDVGGQGMKSNPWDDLLR
jgi:excisionase family DNA binding protein